MPSPPRLAPRFTARPVFGLPVDVPASRPVALLFVRSLGSPGARDALAAVQRRIGELDMAGATVIAFTPSPLADCRDFVPRRHLLFPLVCDEDGSVAGALGVDGAGRFPLRTVLSREMLSPRMVRDMVRLGRGAWRQHAAALVAPSGAVSWSWSAAGALDPIPLDELLEAIRTCSC